MTTTLRLGAEESLEQVLAAHCMWLLKSETFYGDRPVDVDIANQLDACDESPFTVGHYTWPNGVEVQVVAMHLRTVDNVATFILEIGE